MNVAKDAEKVLLKPLDALQWDALGCDRVTGGVERAWIGWCSIFLELDDGRLFYIGYESPKTPASAVLCNWSIMSGSGDSQGNNCKNSISKLGKKIKDIEWGSKQSFVITINGGVFKWTESDFSSSPQPVHELSQSSSPSSDGSHCSTINGAKVISVSCGTTYTCVLYSDGSAKAIEDGDEDEAIDFRLDNDSFISVSCGHEHILLLTISGRVYVYGKGGKGQLGLGSVDENEVTNSQPRLVDALDGIPIEEVVAGGWHSLALSKEGDIYAWGWNESGQLGINKLLIPLTATPTVIILDEVKNWSAIAAGSRHSMAVSSDGSLYSWGWNKYGQLGLDSKLFPSADVPKRVKLGAKVVSISCKYWSSIIVVD